MKNGVLPFTTRFIEKPFELQVWLIITILAGLRTLKAVVQDILSESHNITLLVDVSILTLIFLVFYLIISDRVRTVSVFIGILLTLLIMISYVQFGGIRGASEYNLLGMAVILSMGYSGKRLFTALIIFLLLTVYSTIDLYFSGPLANLFFKSNTTSLDNYFSTTITLVILMLYFKNLLVSESRRIREAREQLSQQNKLIRKKNEELEKQQPILQLAIEELDIEIGKHTRQIVSQDKALEEYIILSTQLIRTPFESIKKNQDELDGSENLLGLLKNQIEELDKVILDLSNKIEHDTHAQIR